MSVEDTVKKRRSVRSYSDENIAKDKVKEIIEAGRLAPSASNNQDWRFVLVEKDQLKEKFVEKAGCQDFVAEARVVLAGVTVSPGELMTCKIPYGIVDLSIALDHISLKAADEGVGTCWIGSFDQGEVKNLLDIPDGSKVVSLMTMGYPESSLDRRKKDRESLDRLMSWNKYDFND